MSEETPSIGHNSVASAELRQLIERIERLEEDKRAVADDIKDVYAEAKGRGYSPKTIRAVIKLRKKDPDKRAEEEAMLEIYLHSLGMI